MTSAAYSKKKILKDILKKNRSSVVLNEKLDATNKEHQFNNDLLMFLPENIYTNKKAELESRMAANEEIVFGYLKKLEKYDVDSANDLRAYYDERDEKVKEIKIHYQDETNRIVQSYMEFSKLNSSSFSSILMAAFFGDMTQGILETINEINSYSDLLSNKASNFNKDDISPDFLLDGYTTRNEEINSAKLAGNITALFFTLKSKYLFIDEDLEKFSKVDWQNKSLYHDYIALKIMLSDFELVKMMIKSKNIKQKIDVAMSGIKIILNNISQNSQLQSLLPSKHSYIDKHDLIKYLLKIVFEKGHPIFALKLMEKLDIHSFEKKHINEIVELFQSSNLSKDPEINYYLKLSKGSNLKNGELCSFNIRDDMLMCHLIFFVESLSATLKEPFIKKNFNHFILGKSVESGGY